MFREIDRKEIREALLNFQAGKSIDENHVRKEILDSWERCKKYSVDPQNMKKEVLSSESVVKRQEECKDLILAADEYLKTLYDSIAGYGGVVLLTDGDGIAIHIVGDAEIVEDQKRTGLGLGSESCESVRGTNAIGVALYLDQPIQIWAEEHYCWDNHKWYCSAATIHDPDGKIIGCLNVSGTSEKVHAHTLGMAIGAAKAIERQIKINNIMKVNELVINEQKVILDMVVDAIIMIDVKGNIIHMNRKAIQMFNIPKMQKANLHIYDLIISGFDLNSIIRMEHRIENEEIDISLIDKDLNCRLTVQYINNKKGGIERILLTFKESMRINELVNKVTGSVAKYTFDNMIGNSKMFKEVIRQGYIAANNDFNVLITGDSGTGKELMAQAIHNASRRVNKPFIAINCGALPRGLIESELFGYIGGAYTGARKEGNPGKFELANGGTIFLDEIGDMPLDVQVTLLRVLQEQEVTRIGGSKSKKIDVKVIAATNKDLRAAVENKSFRQDLYFRLNVLDIHMPSLRERKEDIPLLVEQILNRLRLQTKKAELTIDKEVKEILFNYGWPGNIRELENVLERAVFLCEEGIITAKDLSIKYDTMVDKIGSNKEPNLLDLELIKSTLASTHGNVKKASEELGVTRSWIYRRLYKNNISFDGYR